MGYIMGKAEGLGENWHGHVTALTVAPEFRRIGLGQSQLVSSCTLIVTSSHRLLRVSIAANDEHRSASPDERPSTCIGSLDTPYTGACPVYDPTYSRAEGLVRCRTVIGYYSGEEDAYDMRKVTTRGSLRSLTLFLVRKGIATRRGQEVHHPPQRSRLPRRLREPVSMARRERVRQDDGTCSSSVLQGPDVELEFQRDITPAALTRAR
eukprot:757458-Hanusia_phi.AAC.2